MAASGSQPTAHTTSSAALGCTTSHTPELDAFAGLHVVPLCIGCTLPLPGAAAGEVLVDSEPQMAQHYFRGDFAGTRCPGQSWQVI